MGINYTVERRNLNVVISKDAQYIIPDYQRPYVWEKKQIYALWEDLMQDYMDDPSCENDEYLLGPIVCVSENKRSEIVDGQQRLITLTLLFCAIRESLHGYENKLEGKQNIIYLIAKINKLMIKKDQSPLMILDDSNSNDVIFDIQLDKFKKPSRKDLRNKSKYAKNLIRNYGLLINEAKALCEKCNLELNGKKFIKGIQTLSDILDDLTEKTSFVYIDIRNDVYSHQVFQTLNSTGVALNQADLIRSYLLKIPDINKQDLITKWKNIMSNFEKKEDDFLYESLLSRPYEKNKTDEKTDIQKKSLYQFVKNTYKNNNIVNRYLRELKDDAEFIKLLNDPKNITDQHPNYIKHAFYGIQQIRAIHIKRPIITACRTWGYDDQRTKSIIDCLVKFFFMYRTVCEKNVDTLKKISRKVTYQIINDDKIEFIFWTILKNPKSKNEVDYVDEKEFKEKFDDNTYDFTSGEKKYILASFERELQKPTDIRLPDDLEIEHIFPKNSKNIDWPNREELFEHADRLGNCTLLDPEWNKTLSNRSYKAKREGEPGIERCYLNSKLDINKQHLANYEQWSQNNIEDRERKLCKLVPHVWTLSEYLAKAKKPPINKDS